MNPSRLKTRDTNNDDFTAPAPVRKPKRNLLKRHWLSGALVCLIAGLTVYSGSNFYRTELQLAKVRQESRELDDKLELRQREDKALDDKIAQMSTDKYMELMAKAMGYVYPNEQVYQKGH
jgi:cell division protein FtsB